MSLTPMDIHQKEFKSARLGGYNEEDVDAFLDLVADELEKLIVENEGFKIEIDTIRKKLSEFEEMQSSLQSALITATKSAEDVKTQSTREAEDILFKAKKEAESIIRYAQDESGRIIGEAKNDELRIEKKVEKVRQVKREYLESIRQIADMQIKQVEELEEKDTRAGLHMDVKPPEKPVEVLNSVIAEMNKPVAGENNPETVSSDDEEKVKTESRSVETAGVEGQAGENIGVPAGVKVSDTKTEEDVGHTSSVQQNNPVGGIEMNEVPNVAQNAEEHSQIRKQDLVQEVLGVDFGDDIYSGLEGTEEEKRASGKRMFGRKDRKDKNQFWE